MSPAPLLSVILPVYNGQALLDQAVGSVLSQPLEALEVILVDDGSTDATAALCRAWQQRDRRVRLYRQENAGAAAARNRGLEAAHGTYVAFLDHDDLWLQNFMSTSVLALLARGDDVLVFGYCMTDPSLRRCARRAIHTHEAPGGGALLEPWGHHGAMVFRRQHLLEQGIRYPNLRFSEDVQFAARAIGAARTVWFDRRVMLLYRQRPGSITKTPIRAQVDYMPILESWLALKPWFQTHGENPDAALRFWANTVTACTLGYLQTACGEGACVKDLQALPWLEDCLALSRQACDLTDQGELELWQTCPGRFRLKYRLLEPLKNLGRRAYGLALWRVCADALVFLEPVPKSADESK